MTARPPDSIALQLGTRDASLLGWGLLTAWGLVSLTLELSPVPGGIVAANAVTALASVAGIVVFWAVSKSRPFASIIGEKGLPVPLIVACAVVVSALSVVNQLLQGPGVPKAVPTGIQVVSSFAYITLMFGWFFAYVPRDPQVVENGAIWSTALCAALCLVAILVPYPVAVALWVSLPIASAACLVAATRSPKDGPRSNMGSARGFTVDSLGQRISGRQRPYVRTLADIAGIAICAFTLALPTNLSSFTAAGDSNLLELCSLGGVVLAAALVLWYVSSTHAIGLQSLFKLLYPIAGAGLFCAAAPSEYAATFGLGLSSAGQWALYVYLWIQAVEQCRGDLKGAIGRYAMARMAFDLGGFTAAAVSILTASQAFAGTFPLVYVLFAALAVFTATYALLPVTEGGPVSPLPVQRTAEKPASDKQRDYDRLIAGRVAVLAAQCALSERESQILSPLLRGYSTAAIRNELGIAKGTVDTYIQRIYRKCGVHSRQELVELSEKM